MTNHAAPISSDVQRLAIICPSWVGDTVMATAVLRAARSALPQARIIALARPGIDQLLGGCPWFDDLITADLKGLLGPWRGAGRLRAGEPDAILLLPNSFRAALAARLSGSPLQVGYARDGRGRLLTHALAPERSSVPTSTVDYYAALGRYAFGLETLDPRMELSTTDQQEAAGDTLLKDLGEPFIVLNPGANRVDKRWPAERFAALADALQRSRGMRVLVTGAPSEASTVDAVSAAAASGVVNLLRRGVTLGSLKTVLRRAALLVTNDTGPRHIALALGTPVVSLFGPTDQRWTMIPQARERRLLADPFLPEELIADQHPSWCHIDRISVGDVLGAAEELLDESTDRADAGLDATPPAPSTAES